MSVLTMPTYDFSSIPKHLVCKQAPSISYCKASTPGVSRGRCGNTQLRGTGPVPQHEGSGASSATAAGTGRGVSTCWVQAVISMLYREWVAPGLLLAQMSLYLLCSYLLADAEDAACGCP